MTEATEDPREKFPLYRCHKVVGAAKITAVHATERPGDRVLQLKPPDGPFSKEMPTQLPVDGDWVAKHKPMAGGYYVMYPDGYASYSPAAAFESGYVRIEPEVAKPEAEPEAEPENESSASEDPEASENDDSGEVGDSAGDTNDALLAEPDSTDDDGGESDDTPENEGLGDREPGRE